MIRCLAMDDEPLALKQIVAYINKVPYLQLAAACTDAYEALKVIGEGGIDVIFADIHMPDLSGLDLVRSLDKGPMVVFTTAYADYALEGYKVDAVDYLLKPFGMKEFVMAADKVRRRYDQLHPAPAAPAPAPEQRVSAAGFIYVKTDRRLVRVNVSEIRYVVGMSEYVRIFLTDGRQPLTTLSTMKRMEETLPSETFVRVHKSYIVNMGAIRSISKTNVMMDEETVIPVGESYRDAFYRWVEERSVGR